MRKTITLLVAFLCICGNAFSQQAITAANTTSTSGAAGTTYTATGAPGSSISGNSYTYNYGSASGLPTSKVFLNNFTAGGTMYVFDYGMTINVVLNRVNNASATGQRDLIYNEGSINTATTPNQININAPYVPSMSTLFIGNDDLRSGTDNIFGNQGDGSDNNNNIERLDVRVNGNTGYTVGDPAKEGFAVFERGAANGHDPFVVSVIVSLNGSGEPSGYQGFKRLTGTSYGTTNPIANSSYIVLRKEAGPGNLQASVAVTNQGIGGIFFRFADFGIAAGARVYGYSLAGADFPAGATESAMVDYTNATNFPTNTASSGAGGIDLTAITGVFKIFNDDLDGIPNTTDVDDDNDGILDVDENGGVNPFGDTDGDGMQNYVDPTPGTGMPAFVDANSDGINDAYDADKDGHVNQIDLDSDNDGIPDIVEAGGVDQNGNGFIDGGVADADGDGLMTPYDWDNGGVAIANLDTDGDGIRNFLDLDSDNDGIGDVVEAGGVDANGDGRVDNFLDTDSDGYDDTIDGDAGNDGVSENTAKALLVTGADGNADGRPDSYPQGIANTDGRSLPNAFDLDSDNDGISDVVEAGGVDANNDGKADSFIDADGDGFADTRDGDVGNDGTAENTANVLIITGPDADDNGRPDSYPRANADGLGVPNAYDLDSDNDGVPDLIESGGIDSNGDGRIDGLVDADGNGWQNEYDPTQGGINIRLLDANGAIAGGVFDFDGDGIANYLDLDSDNDGIPDIIEQGGADSGNDGKADVTTDSDNDGFSDAYDPLHNGTDAAIAGATPLITAAVIDAVTKLPTVYSAGSNFDASGLINMLDLDADGDGLLDTRESGLAGDTNGDGVIGSGDAGFADANSDGWADAVDTLAALSLTNADGVANPDYLDIDADNDGITDNIEGQATAGYLAPLGTDTDADGIDDRYDNSTAAFGGNASNGITPVNTDGTDLPDYRDTDSDNDADLDIVEGNDLNLNKKADDISGSIPTTDTDGDGLLDFFESNVNSGPVVTIAGFGGASGSGRSTAQKTLVTATERDWRNSAFSLTAFTLLPVKFISVAATMQAAGVAVVWTVAEEQEVRHYIVERSTDGGAFTPVGTVAYKAATTAINEYRFTDKTPSGLRLQYRIRQTDLDGSSMISKPVAVQTTGPVTALTLYPNPVQASSKIYITAAAAQRVVITVTDVQGRRVTSWKTTVERGRTALHAETLQQLPSGMYVVTGTVDGIRHRIKIKK